jgi:hypothetical protein
MRFAPLGIKPRRKMFYCSTAALFMFTHIWVSKHDDVKIRWWHVGRLDSRKSNSFWGSAPTFWLTHVRLQFRTQKRFCNVPSDSQVCIYIEFQFNLVSVTLREGYSLTRLPDSEVLRRYLCQTGKK